MAHFLDRRTSSSSSQNNQQRSPSPPSQTFHPALVPTPIAGLVGVAAGGSHYSGAKIHHRRSDVQRASFGGNVVQHIDLDEQRTRILDDLKELYSCRPTTEILQRLFRHDAIYEDPLTHCKGLKEISSQWFAMPKLFSNSETLTHRVLSSTHNPHRIIYSQTQQYTVRLLGIKRTVKSIIIVDLDDDGKIAKLEDQWNGEEPPSAWGLGALRRLNGKAVHVLLRAPKVFSKAD